MTQVSRSLSVLIALILFLALFLSPLILMNGAQAQTRSTVAHTAPIKALTDRLIVRFKDHVSNRTAQGVMSRFNTETQQSFRYVRQTRSRSQVYRFDDFKDEQAWQALKDWLEQDANVAYVEPDYLLKPMQVQSSEQAPETGSQESALDSPQAMYHEYQWPLTDPLSGINTASAWQQADGSGVVVAVLDTGYQPHPDLQDNIVPGYDMVSDSFISNDDDGRDADPTDPGDYSFVNECGFGIPEQNSTWHGTHVAGTIAAMRNQQGITGVAYGAKVQPIRVLGTCGGYVSDIADGILWAAGVEVSDVPTNPTPAQVINLSLGGQAPCINTLQDAINQAVAKNVVVITASGNEGGEAGLIMPANCDNVVTVAATDHGATTTAYSNTGGVVDISAPGGKVGDCTFAGVLSTLNKGAQVPGRPAYGFYQGTSMAAAHVSGIAALMLSLNPSLSPQQVKTLLENSAKPSPGLCSECGAGIVDAGAALAQVLSE